METYSADENVLVSPDKNAVVKQRVPGRPTSDCPEAARKVLGW